MSNNTFTTVSPGTVVDCRQADELELQVTGLSGGDTITVGRSLDKIHYVDAELLTSTLDPADNPVVADGIFVLLNGACHLDFTQSGSASTPKITVRITTDG